MGDCILISASSLDAKNYNTIIGSSTSLGFEVYFSNYEVNIWQNNVKMTMKSQNGTSGYGNIKNIEIEISEIIGDYNTTYQLFGYDKTYLLIGRIYNCKIVGKANLIPALDPAGKPGMYDTITQQPFYKSGVGEFGYELLDGTYVAPI